MVLGAFDVHDQIANAAVVFARDRDHAIALANQHLASFRGYTSTQMTALERPPALGGPARHHLLAAIAAGVPGIGHQQEDGGWVVLPPGDRSVRTVRPRPTQLFFYIDDEDYQVVLFASDQDRADALYDAIQADYRLLPSEWLGSEWDVWSTCGLVRHKRQAEERGVEGIGIYNPDGWLVLPLDYEALGVTPPPD
ncbi:hypothetical protein AVM11_18375 [Sphingomonas melonis TY]|uniref:Uncharacterized protein n=1 Tax=Sphingomonas melonis TY TaxID=621456 RepID=A0A175Y1D4_9SPHN|nr:hypothetical protein [Sphingomonas melonis]AOW22832.1 hypothetical protein BJP26_04015 [Sphingomonas melonis TY]KZB94564.1 hypothetical protein AVM11_18375 [Sphingomonas melonis TY]